MLLYLAEITRPGSVFAVHQSTHFSHTPKDSHGVGIKTVARYLKVTREKGLMMIPDKDNLKPDFVSDAYFTVLFCSEDFHEPISVKSRTGILLNFGKFPIY